jgi:hypothetical protein
MPVQFSKAAIIAKNNTAIDASDLSIATLEGMFGLPVSKEAVRIARLNRARTERTQLRSVNAHYNAAGTVVKPMAEQTAEELNALGNKLDKQIQDDLIVDATISFITSVLGDVSRLRTITEAHKG